jgi:ATP-dependent protease ClpP protease subunit
MAPEDAVKFGLIDKVISRRDEAQLPPSTFVASS